MKKAIALLCALLLAVCCCGRAEEWEELLFNGEIDFSDDGTAWGWQEDAWDETASFFDVCEEEDGTGSLHIVNLRENDARWTQTVTVEPMTFYRVSARVKAACDPVGAGANLSVENTQAYSASVYDTGDEWVDLELYGMTGDTQTYMTLYLRVGGYSATGTGEAWFDDISLERVDAVPDDVQIASFEDPYALEDDDFFIDTEPEEKGMAAGEKAAWLTSIVFAILAVLLLREKPSANENVRMSGNGTAWRMAVLLTVALLARLFTALLIRGYDTDLNCFLAWSQRVFRGGLNAFYDPDMFCDYPPGYIALLWPVGALRALFGLEDQAAGAVLLVKLPCILADLGVCAMLYRHARRRCPEGIAIALSLLYAVCPAVILNSAGWGQSDGMLVLLLLPALLYAADRRWVRAMLLLALAVLVKPQALLFAPLGFTVWVIELIRSKEDRRALLIGAAGFLAVLAVLPLPFTIGHMPEMAAVPAITRPFVFLWEIYTRSLGSYNYYSVSACNLYDLMGLGWVDIGGSGWIGYAAYAAAFAFAGVLYYRSKRRGRLMLIAAAMLGIMFCFGLKMHERYLFPAIALFLCAFAEDRDVRIVLAAASAAIGQLINAMIVLIYGYTVTAPGAACAFASCMHLLSCGLGVWAAADLILRDRAIPVRIAYMQGRERSVKRPGTVVPVREDWHIRLKKGEIWTVLLVTALYSVFTFVNLGTFAAPQTSWTSTAPGESVVFDLGEEKTFMMTYYGGICDCSFTVEFSDDGTAYTEPLRATYDQGEIFRWLRLDPVQGGEWDEDVIDAGDGRYYRTARYIRLSAEEAGLVLSEVGFLNEDGEPWPVAEVSGEGCLLMDEQDTVPETPSYYNSSYFDEIYHVRTAYEHIHGMHTYEWTHPPLGKLLIACGILLFGMCPFGWRFAGALSGVLMLPVMYLTVRQLTKKKQPALFAMLLMALDCMHFTQSRLGTIDCFAVLFIMLMYLFMFRYAKMSFYHQPLRETLVPLALCGLAFALGCATKWICIYAGVGLAVIFFYTLYRRWSEYRAAGEQERTITEAFRTKAGLTCLWCCLFFVVIPVLVYGLSYYWQLTPDGNFNPRGIWETQLSMFDYHNGLSDDTHFFRSPWYEWPLIVKPMWYYSGTEFQPEGIISSISCMGNPAVWWGGLIGLGWAVYRAIRTRGRDRNCLLLVIGFASQYLPWVLVPRSTFIYHYFASVPFIILCSALMLERLQRTNELRAKRVRIGWIAAAALLCAMFYPLMSGLPVARSYAQYLRWFNWYNF